MRVPIGDIFVGCFLRSLDNIVLGNELRFDPLDLQFHLILSRIQVQQRRHPLTGNALTVNINRQKSICRRLR